MLNTVEHNAFRFRNDGQSVAADDLSAGERVGHVHSPEIPEADVLVQPPGHARDETIAEFIGVLCTYTVHTMRSKIDEFVRTAASDVLIDLTAVTFIDGRGLKLMLAIRSGLADRGLRCHIVEASPLARRLLDITGYTDLLSENSIPG